MDSLKSSISSSEEIKIAQRPPQVPSKYEVEIDSKISRIAKTVLQVLLFPWGLHEGTHRLIGLGVYLSTARTLGNRIYKKIKPLSLKIGGAYEKIIKNDQASFFERKVEKKVLGRLANLLSTLVSTLRANHCHKELTYEAPQGFEDRKFTVIVDGKTIDGHVLINNDNPDSRRFTLMGCGNAELMEDGIDAKILKNLLSHGVVFNRSGSGKSGPALPNRRDIAKAHAAVMRFILDQEKGLQAKELICWEHSMSAAAQEDAFELNKNVKTEAKILRVRHQTFGELSTLVSRMFGKPFFGQAIRFFGWNYQSAKQFKEEGKIQQLVVQHISSSSDGVIPKSESLLTHLEKQNKLVESFKVWKGHNGTYGSEERKNVTNKVLTMLAQ